MSTEETGPPPIEPGTMVRQLYPLMREHGLNAFVDKVIEPGMSEEYMPQILDSVVIFAKLHKARETANLVAAQWESAKIMIRERAGALADERTIQDLLGIMEGVLVPVKLAKHADTYRERT